MMPRASCLDLPQLCDTVEEQQSSQCQSICSCDCTEAVPARRACRRVCRLPNGTQSVPWCTSTPPSPTPETVLPTGATPSNPLRVFFLAGQSGCVGQGSVAMLDRDPNPSYSELKGIQEGVWFAGFMGGAREESSSFYIGPMIAGEASKTGGTFGPEVSIGRRLSDADVGSAPVLVVKYCWGGSNAEREWNPQTAANSWDRDADDGTALWLLNESGGATNLRDKDHLYANLIYTARRSLEALDDGGVPYELSGLFWQQGSADKKRTWRQYGEDLVTLFSAVRTDLKAPGLPVVDLSGTHDNIVTGKTYAASVIDGCNAVVPKMSMAAADPDDTSCVIGPKNPCLESTFINFDVFNYYGWDPVLNVPPFSSLKPPGSSDDTFYWFKDFPNDQHSEYEGAILQGRVMANAYVRSFTDDELQTSWLEDDMAIQFPLAPCNPAINDGKPSEGNICWMDLREDADLAEAICPSNGSRKSTQLRGPL